MLKRWLPLSVCCVVLLGGCGGGSGGGGGGGSTSLSDRSLQGGDTTSLDRTTLAFENPSSNLDDEGLQLHFEGDANFGDVFVSPPATFNGGLGPIFNNNSCDACHTKNGRGQPVFGTGPRGSQALLRISVTDGTPELPGGPGIVPDLGTQLQDHAIFGSAVEGTVNLNYAEEAGAFADGTAYSLRRPILDVKLANGSSLPASVMTSVRAAPPVFGLGLLEAIPDTELQALADPDDANGDGISGRTNIVWDPLENRERIGKFGRKANRPTLLQQIASAYANDIGVSNSVFVSGTDAQEIDDATLFSVEFYVQSLAVPVAGDTQNPVVQRGETLFSQTGCAGCHIPRLQTGDHPVVSVSNQTIFPYTDLLLHDMGPDLADGRPDFLASGSEWRTSPLWGIGITATILSNTATFLHDGRARSLEEAILWHGGEALPARETFRSMSKDDRDALTAFLRSL